MWKEVDPCHLPTNWPAIYGSQHTHTHRLEISSPCVQEKLFQKDVYF